MDFNQVWILADRNQRSTTLREFLATPGKILEAAVERIWLGPEESFGQIPRTRHALTDTDVAQFHSDTILQELMEVASPSVNASLGILGLTSIRKPIVEATLADRDFDPTRKESALSAEFFLAVAEHCELWQRHSLPGSSSPYFSMLPVEESGSDQHLLKTLRSLTDDRLTHGNWVDRGADEIRAGLLLIHDFLEPSHQVSQSIEGEGRDANGDYWHAIMHRREPDFGNSKYWFRRVGKHPCFEKLAAAARRSVQQFNDPRAAEWIEQLTRSGWDSLSAVDLFQEAHQPRSKGTAFHQFASCLQMQEMLLLLTYCCRQCTNDSAR